MQRKAPSAGGAVAALVALLLAAPAPATAVDRLLAARDAVQPAEPLVALVALAAWALTGWLVLAAVLTLLAHLPGAAGRLGRALARRVAPAALRRAVEVALGLTVTVAVTGTGTASATSAAPPPGPASAAQDNGTTGSTTWQQPDLDWPRPQPPDAAPAPDGAEVVVVRPGDSLWTLAERDLERREGTRPCAARTAAAWPTWWAANRDVIGPDPDLLRPGTALRPPPAGA